MAVSTLNIALRLDSREFERGIRRAERAAQSMSNNLRSAGNNFALAFTVPLAVIGGAAIRAAGEFERLQRAIEATMTGAGYTIAQAGVELEKLREIAKAPGLDFKEAVEASNRLQSVGLSAEQARETIKQFANGVAAAGGTAQNLNGVTVQLAQMIAKGKVLTQDLKIIKENMPSVSTAMVRAFGTADAEGIQKLNISADEFVRTITEELAKTPRVVGGLANSMVNAQAAITQAAVKLGDTLNKTFDITGTLDRFGDWVTGLADKFAALDEGTKKAIIGIGIFAAALGPAIRFGGALVSASAGIVNGIDRISLAFAKSAKAGTGFIGVIKGIDLATKLTVLGAFVGIVVAAAVAFKAMNSEGARAANVQRSVARAMIDAAATVEDQKNKVELLAGAVKNVLIPEEQRNAALRELNRIVPETNGLTLKQKDLTIELDKATGRYIDTLIRKAKAEAAASAIGANATRRAQLDLDKAQLVGGVGGRGGGFAALENARKRSAIDKEIKQLNALDAEYKKIIDSNGGVAAAVAGSVAPFEDSAGATDKATKAAKALAKAYEELDAITEQLLDQNEQEKKSETAYLTDVVFKQNDLPTDGPNLAIDTAGFGIANQQVLELGKNLNNIIPPSRDLLLELNQGVITFGQTWEETGKKVAASGSVIAGMAYAAADAMMQAAADGKTSFKELAGAALAGAAQFARAKIIEGVASAVSSALTSVPFPYNLIAGALAGAAAGALFTSALTAIGVPRFAEGGLAYGKTLALVGEYQGASSNPEVIAPLSKLEAMINRSGGGDQYLYSIISGDDIILVSDRSRKKRDRYR